MLVGDNALKLPLLKTTTQLFNVK